MKICLKYSSCFFKILRRKGGEKKTDSGSRKRTESGSGKNRKLETQRSRTSERSRDRVIPTKPFVFCRLYPFSPFSPTCHLSALTVTSTVSPVRARYPYICRGFVGHKKKTSVGLLVFNPL